jgi:hypothetical protein
LDPPAIAQLLELSNWLISKVRVSSSDRARDAIDLVAATVDAFGGVVEHTIFGVDLFDSRAPTRGIVSTEDVLKIAGQQGRYGIGHGYCFSFLGSSVACQSVSGTPDHSNEHFPSADAVNTTKSPQLPKYVSAAFGSLDQPWKPGHLRSAYGAICFHPLQTKEHDRRRTVCGAELQGFLCRGRLKKMKANFSIDDIIHIQADDVYDPSPVGSG